MYCPKCGRNVGNQENFCHNCGQSLSNNHVVDKKNKNSDNASRQFAGYRYVPFDEGFDSKAANRIPDKEITSHNVRVHIDKLEPWYTSTGWIIALLVIFFPIGAYLMWRYSKWKEKTKIIISVILILVCFGRVSSVRYADYQRKSEANKGVVKIERDVGKSKAEDNIASEPLENEKKETAKNQKTQSETEEETMPEYLDLSEVDYKAQCESYSGESVKQLGDSAVEKHVRVELMTQEKSGDGYSDMARWKCGFKNVSDIGIESYASYPCYINDVRQDKSFEIELYDKIVVYGKITANREVSTWTNVFFATDIEAMYIEYVGEFAE